MRRLPCLVVLLALTANAAHAASLTYYSDGCNEYIMETFDFGPNIGVKWRMLYRCCGSTCFIWSEWSSMYGPINACGIAIRPPANGGSDRTRYDADGNALVDVPPGRGGVISWAPDLTCYPFIPNNGDVIVVPRGLL